jgi:hypothetical protein
MKSILINLLIFFVLLMTACSVKNEPVIIKFEGAYFEKKWAIKELNPELPSDWSSSGFLTFEFNSSTTHRFELKLYDTEGIRSLEIVPFQGVWIRASIPLVHFQKVNTEGMDMASIGKTPRIAYWISFSESVGSIKHVDSLGFSMSRPIGSPTLEIRNVRITMASKDSILSPKLLVDKFGQWIPDDWVGKAKTIDELKTDWNQEEKDLQTVNLKISKYGGFIGKKTKATGFFHVEKIDGKWWFVDPEGYLFFSSGSTCINAQDDFSRIRGREYIFSALPPDVERNTSNQTTKKRDHSSFYTWNLFRRFGPDWYQKWMDLTFRRMDSWGINTVANWSDPNLGSAQRKPFVATIDGWGIETGIMGMPDVYANDYIARVDSAAARQCAPLKENTYLLGYFIGNEVPWPRRELELVALILSGKDTPMKVALKKYLSVGDTPERRKAFIYETFAKLIGIVNAAVKKYDPNHLNLGIRYGDVSHPDEMIKIAKSFDVFSFNMYGYALNPLDLNKISELTGLPIIIGEFHFGTPGRGHAPGLAQVSNQAERGVAYRYYVENAAAHPSVVGTHWFQWIDQPSTGRSYDGENYNIGLVDVTDRPYPEMINAVKETFKRLQDVHSGKEAPVSKQAIVQ